MRLFDARGAEPALVLDHGGDQTFADRAGGEKCVATPTEILGLLLEVADAVAEAHHFGLTHGALRSDTIGVVDGAPRLEFTGFAVATEAADAELGTHESKAADACAFAELIAWALERAGVEEFCRDASHREAARLRQLIARQLAPTGDQPPIALYAECLRSIVAPEGVTEARQAAENTAEIPRVPVDVLDSDTTSEMPPSLASSDGTHEVDLSRPASLIVGRNREPVVGDRLGRFQIERKLGEGGMGAVFKAIDLGSGEPVAVKVLSQSAMLRGNAVRRFAKEARLLASLNNPHITNLIEVSEEEGLHFIALEYVDGIDVGQVLRNQGRLKERAALSIAADVALALVDAHRREIVHRDIKPENILLVGCKGGDKIGDPPPRAKLADFGIARHIDQSESLAVTQAGALLGTPKYMSPEQCRGRGDVAPQSDVYSLGVTLFELLAGEAPFVADDPMALAGKHCFDAPPALRKLVSDLSEPTAELVAKCLAKRPEDRFADADAVLKAIDRLLRGEPTHAAQRPLLPSHDASRVIGSTMTWRMESSADSLWPYVSNTERLNRAIGLPPVEYRTVNDPQLGVRRFATIRIAGFAMSWEEHPFEWVEGRRMSVFREFSGGPFQWFISTVELVPDAESGCELRHTINILPRNAIGRLIARVETGSKCRRSLDKVYRRIDETLAAQKCGVLSDAFEATPRLKRRQQERLVIGEQALVTEGVPRSLAETLVRFLREAPDQEVAKIRPVRLARQLGVNEDELLDTCLRSVSQGLLTLQWDLLCPTCRVAADAQSSLREIKSHTHCEACDLDFKSDVSGAIELVFRAHSEVRDVSVGLYCIGGPWHAPHVVMQLRLEPGERVETELALTPGDYVLRGPRLTQAYSIRVASTGAPSCQEFVLKEGGELDRTYVLRAGGQSLSFENTHPSQQLVRLERTIPRDDVYTAARASATPRFRELFPAEVLESGRLVAAEQVTMLTASIPSIDELYNSRGDAEAYSLVERHLSECGASIRSHGGEVVKVIGETIVASFNNARRAVEAAFDLATRRDGERLTLAVGVHRGPALVTTANDRLDYFGATARQATALPSVAGEGIALTEAVLAEPEVAGWLAGEGRVGKVRIIDLPGKSGQVIQFYESA
ncbi:Serine/threonine-protein kinase StkP [Botrimarina colliarenosi]|uniref:Serine/threonine-protein kinase StkP n=1 Tax=Botrimarina colliarenosi TaxID=2528001 RepID=A0A5C6ADZ3_9BACT|nr:protein kinase [Botrimarina colliarenosi]TWT97627.1 Serine/threonine-protein kinase StkP [Botrimarina colliarenosi]